MTKTALKIAVCLAALLASGCSGYNKLLKSKDHEQMYQAALKYFDQGQFDKALTLFDEVSPYFKGTAREDTILFYTADAHFRTQDYETSCAEFDDYRRRFGRSHFVEEAEYKYAMGYYYMSPEPNRDQTPTYMAINTINDYLQRYPNSLKRQLCLLRLDELQGKLYDKAYINARTYYKIGRYKSAVIALRNALKEYPETPHREEILYLTVKSCYELAANSIKALQRDRYLDMMDAYYTFIADFPESKYRKELDRLQKAARRYLAEHPADAVAPKTDQNNE